MSTDEKDSQVPLGAETSTAAGVAPVSIGRGPTLQPGQLLGTRYRIVRSLGAGGMGEVYEAEDLDLRVRVAVKTIKPELFNSPIAIERVRREVQLARTVTDPHVCRLFDLSHAQFEGGTLAFITMELLEGETLLARLRREGSFSADAAEPLAIDLAQGLDACHQAGILHRDLKSENVQLVMRKDRLHAVLTDFGIAQHQVPTENATLTGEGHLVGSLAFMPPEVLGGQPATVASDIFELGVVLWELVIGVWPLRGRSAVDIVRTAVTPFPVAADFPPDMPRLWKNVIVKALAHRPEDRFASVSELIDEIAPDSSSRRRVSRPSVPVVSMPRPRRRRRPLALVALAVLVGFGALGTSWWLSTHPPAPSPEGQAPSGESVELQLKRMEYRDAAAAARRALNNTPDDSDWLRRLAEAQMGVSDYAGTLATLKWLRAGGKKLPRRLVLEVEQLEQHATEDYDRWLASVGALAATNANDPWFSLRHAEALIRLEREGEAKALLTTLEPRAANDPVLAARLALASAQLANASSTDIADAERTAKAAEVLSTQAGARAVHARALTEYSVAIFRLGKFDEAAAIARTAVSEADALADPWASVGARLHLFFVLNASGLSRDEGAAAVNQALLDVEKVGDASLRAMVRVRHGMLQLIMNAQLKPALQDFEGAVQLLERSHRPRQLEDTQVNFLVALSEAGDLRRARELAAAIERESPTSATNPYFFLNNGFRLWLAGDLRGADASMSRAAQLSRNDNGMLGTCLANQTAVAVDAADAKRIASLWREAEAMSKATGDKEATDELAWAEALLKLDESPLEVIKTLNQALSPEPPGIAYRSVFVGLLGRAYVRAGRLDAAREQATVWAATPGAQEYLDGRVQGALLMLELADSREAVEVAQKHVREVYAVAVENEALRASWDLALGLAHAARRSGDLAEARAQALKVKADAGQHGYLRLSHAADKLLAELARQKK